MQMASLNFFNPANTAMHLFVQQPLTSISLLPNSLLSRSLPFNFPHPCITQSMPPIDHQTKSEAWNIDYTRVNIGKGRSDYKKAVKLLNQWHHFSLPWTWVNKPSMNNKNTPVVVTANTILWSMQPLRITYKQQTSKKTQFAHTTLQGHQLSGEEKFLVDWDGSRDGDVCFEIFTLSKPATPIAVIAYPLLRFYQKKFGRDAAKAMKDGMAM